MALTGLPAMEHAGNPRRGGAEHLDRAQPCDALEHRAGELTIFEARAVGMQTRRHELSGSRQNKAVSPDAVVVLRAFAPGSDGPRGRARAPQTSQNATVSFLTTAESPHHGQLASRDSSSAGKADPAPPPSCGGCHSGLAKILLEAVRAPTHGFE